ncbi:MAG: hypothetical protein H7Y88_02740 [Phycisphaerales bacterium]|nr:hypothetical protein [Phycisphaerales bacterium]
MNGSLLQAPIFSEGASTGARFVYVTGTVTIGATGSITLAAGSGAGLNINSLSGVSTLINQGIIRNQAPTETLLINTNINFTNSGTLDAQAGGTLRVNATNWTTPGTIAASGGGIIQLDGTLDTTAGEGTFNTAGGVVRVEGTITNTGNTIDLTIATGSWSMFGGTINGGTFNFTGGASIQLTTSGGRLAGVDVNGDLIAGVTNSYVEITGTTRFEVARLQNNNSNIRLFDGYILLDDIVGEGVAAGARIVYLTGTVTIGATGSVTIAPVTGAGLNLTNLSGVTTLINQGLMSSEAAGRTLQINSTNFTHSGELRALGGGIISRDSGIVPFVNSGVITLGPASRLNIGGDFTNGPTGIINIQLGGANPTGNHGRIVVANDNTPETTGAAILDGTLNVTLAGAYTPVRFDRFDAVTAVSVTGTFDAVTFPVPALNRKWVTLYEATRVQLLYTSIADFDNSGSIQSPDITSFLSAWFADIQNGTTVADFNHDGVTGSSDITAFLSAWFFALGGG